MRDGRFPRTGLAIMQQRQFDHSLCKSLPRSQRLHAGGGPNTRTAFKPPKANEFDIV